MISVKPTPSEASMVARIDAASIFADPPAKGGKGGDAADDAVVVQRPLPPLPLLDSESVPLSANVVPFPPIKRAEGGEGGALGSHNAIASDPPLLPLVEAAPGTVPEAAPLLRPSIEPPEETELKTPPTFVAEGVFTPAPTRNLVIAALTAQGGYLKSLGNHRHAVTCPWAADHVVGDAGEAIYTEPDDHAPYGQYHCPHQHQDKPNLMSLLDRLDIEPQRARGKPCIRIEAGEQNLVQAAAEYVLASRPGFYQAGGSIVAIKGMAGNGDVGIDLVNEQTLTMALSAAADWEKYDGRSKGSIRCDPPARVCQMLIKGQEYRFLRDLKALPDSPSSEGRMVG